MTTRSSCDRRLALYYLLLVLCTSCYQGLGFSVKVPRKQQQQQQQLSALHSSLDSVERNSETNCISTSGCLGYHDNQLLQCLRRRCFQSPGSSAMFPVDPDSDSWLLTMDVDDSTVETGDDNDDNIDVVQTASLNDGDMMACIETHCRTGSAGLQSASASNPNVSGASDVGADLATCIYESCMSRDSAGSLRTPDHLADVDLNLKFKRSSGNSAENVEVVDESVAVPDDEIVVYGRPRRRQPSSTDEDAVQVLLQRSAAMRRIVSRLTAASKSKRGGFVDSSGMCISFHCGGMGRQTLGFLRCVSEHHCT